MSETREITSPYKFPLLGHTPYLLGAFPSGKIGAIGRERDGLWRVCLPNSSFIAVTCFRILDELCDESRFEKRIHGGQVEIRKVVQKGLFTANTDDQEWGRAHRILMPGFGSKAMGTYLPVMNSVALDLVESWHGRVGSPIDVNRDMTMASLEVIGVCGFDYHFADFSNYRESAFVKKMKSMFYDANLSTVFSDTWMNILFASHFRRQSSIKVMNGLVDDVIQKRLIDPAAHRDKRDFLSLMLDGADKKDGSKLDQENIRHQLITFLAAGYETTAALLGFCFYYLIKYPEVAHKARASVDAVFANKAGDHLTFKDISGLGYLKMVTHEALRLWPTASGFFLGPKAKTIVDGQYEVTPDDVFFVSLPGIHRDPAVWGEGADTFDPEHFSPQRVKQTPRNAFKPFGNGVRACIGRHFAITEVVVILAHALRAFDFIDYADYQLSVDESVTLKVKNFSMKVKPRDV